jgi:hypothetical protein
MVDEPELTNDRRVKLTTVETDMLQLLLDAHDRGGFYMAYNAMTDSAEAGLQSRIATFSGNYGGITVTLHLILLTTASNYGDTPFNSSNYGDTPFNSSYYRFTAGFQLSLE